MKQQGSETGSTEDRENPAQPLRSVDSAFAIHDMKPPFRIAAPSFVIPDTVAGNCRFLDGRFSEVGIACFESAASIAYTDDDLPRADECGLDYHLHLPLDLDWSLGLETAWPTIDAIIRRFDFISPTAYVLHPPADPALLAPLAERFREAGVEPADVLLENVEDSELTLLWDEAQAAGFSICLDLGHCLAFGQQAVPELPGIWERVRMLHIYGTDENGSHLSLAKLDDDGWVMLVDWLNRMPENTVVMLELFSEQRLFESLELFAGLCAREFAS